MFTKITNSKKGQITQILTFVVVIFVIGITIILGRTVLNSFYNAIESENTDAMTEAQVVVQEQYQVFDYGLVTLSILLIVGLIITSFLIPTHPIFFVINIIGIFLLVFLGMILTNIYGELVAGEVGIENGLDEVADGMPKVNFILSYLPYLGAIVLFIVSIVQFSKGRGSDY